MKGFASKRIALKVDVLSDRKIYCLQARSCTFQPGNCTGWSSEGVNVRVYQDVLVNSRWLLHVQITADMLIECSAISYRTVSSNAVTVFRSMIRMYRAIRSSWCGKET